VLHKGVGLANDTAQATDQGDKAAGFFEILFNVLVAPSEAFAAVLKRPAFWAPLLLCMAIHAAFVVVWMKNVDPVEFMRARMADSPGSMDRIPPEQRAGMLEQQAKFLPIMAWAGPVFVLIYILAAAGLMTFVYRFFFAGEVTFRQGLALTAWINAGVGLVTTPLLLLVMYLKDDWTVNPPDALQANPTLLVDRDNMAKPLYTLLGSLDFFSFWILALFAIGFGMASRARFGSAIWGVGTVWLIYVLGKAGLAFFF